MSEETQTPAPSPAAISTVIDLDTAPDGTVMFAVDAANLPETTGEGGTVTTAREGDIGWQLAAFANRPRIIWQRTWHAADNRWRSWKRFEDSRNTARSTAAAIASAITASEQEMAALIDGRIASEESARATAITSAVTTAIDDLRTELPATGLDRYAVTALIDAEITAELADERAARNDAIAAATSSLAAGRQALIDASITSAITAERVAADQRADAKVARVTTRLEAVADDLTAETAARIAAMTAAGSAMEARVTAERDARTAALATQRRATAGEIAEARQEQASALQTATLAERGARDQAIAAAKSEVTRDTTAQVTTLLRGLEGRATQTINAGIAAASFPRGTRMLFQQSTAPAGWTKDAALNDKALRVTSGPVGRGGSKGFAATFGQPRVSGSVSSSISGRTGGHRLSVGEMPSHTHGWSGSVGLEVGSHDSTSYPGTFVVSRHARFAGRPGLTGSNAHTGGNQPHSHAADSLRVSSAFTGNALDLRLAYVDVIVAVKD